MKCLERCFKKKEDDSVRDSPVKNENVSYLALIKPPPGKRRSLFNKEMVRKTQNTKSEKSEMKPLYNLKDKFYCFVFCNGTKCKHENYLRKSTSSDIEGLNCDQITTDLFASQRPSTILINQYNLVNEFKKKNIGLIINLQRQGEHPYCGPNKLEVISGYSYIPAAFAKENIKVLESGWKDMNVPHSIDFMMNIVKEMSETIYIENKKVLVHCHAGYGRTGVVLACFILYCTNKTVDTVVSEIRAKRPKCIQKNDQMEYCKMFKACK